MPCGFAAALGRRRRRRPQLHSALNSDVSLKNEKVEMFGCKSMRQREHLAEATATCWVTSAGEAIRAPLSTAASWLNRVSRFLFGGQAGRRYYLPIVHRR